MRWVRCLHYFRRLIACGLVACCAGAGCIKQVEHRWRAEPLQDLQSIVPGRTTKDEVQALFGSPTVHSVVYDRAQHWFYVSSTTEHVAFLAPKVLEQQVVALAFNDHDVVQHMKVYTQNDIRVVEMAKEHLETPDDQISLFDQVVGNIGRFTAPASARDRVMRGGR